MKQITLFRHGKSSWKYPIADQFRPLNDRGMQQALHMANNCSLLKPELILSSSAIRAMSTALIYIDINQLDSKSLSCCSQLYEYDPRRLLNWLADTDEDIERLWLFGHNPTFNDLCALLLGYQLDNIVTSGYVVIDINTDSWRELATAKANLVEFNNRNL